MWGDLTYEVELYVAHDVLYHLEIEVYQDSGYMGFTIDNVRSWELQWNF